MAAPASVHCSRRATWFVLVSIFAVLGAAAPSAAQESTAAARHRDRGAAFLAKGDSAAALAAYREALAIDPHDAAAHDAIGVILGDSGDLTGAIAAFREAIRLDPALAMAHFHVGLALERTAQAHEAVAAFVRSLRLDPKLVEARYALSSVCAALGDLDGAIALLRQVVATVPNIAEAHYNLGIHLETRYKRDQGPRNAGDLDSAVEALKAAARLAPDQARIHAALGRLLAEKQDLAGAVARLRLARSLEPNRVDHAYDLGLALRLAGDFEGAESQLRVAVTGNPRHGLARRALALVLRTKGDLRGAASELRAAVAVLPDDAQAHHLLGSILLKLADPSGAFEALRRAIDLDPALTEARVALAQALARTGQRNESRRQQEAIQQINAQKAGVARALVLLDTARELLNQGDAAAAIELLNQARDLAPTLTDAHFQSALAMIRADAAADLPAASNSRDPALIESALLRVLDLDPAHARAYLELGRLHSRRGDTAPALAALRRAVSLAPGLLDAQRALADQAAALDDWPTFIAALEVVLAWQPDDTATLLRLGHGLIQQRDCAGANAVFRRAVQLPQNGPALLNSLEQALESCSPKPGAPPPDMLHALASTQGRGAVRMLAVISCAKAGWHRWLLGHSRERPAFDKPARTDSARSGSGRPAGLS